MASSINEFSAGMIVGGLEKRVSDIEKAVNSIIADIQQLAAAINKLGAEIADSNATNRAKQVKAGE